jgi:EmrB/QacA subfamily drug resistance transporter
MHERAIPAVHGALACLALSILLSSLGTSIANVALPTLASAFSASFEQVQWIVLAYLLAMTTLVVSAGRLGDIIGRRRLLLSGLVLFTLASACCAMAPTFGLLVAARAVQGLGAAIMAALGMAIVGEAVPRERTGSAMGLLGTMSAVGTALGPSLGGFMITAFGWRSIFFLNIPLGLLALYLAGRFLPTDGRKPRDARSRFDSLGTLLLAATLAAYALAMTMGRGAPGWIGASLILATVSGGGLFLLVEARVRSPLIQLAAFRGERLSINLSTSAVVATVMMTTFVVGPFYLSRVFALDEAAIGMVMAVGPVISILSGVFAGRIVDRLGAPRLILIGLTEMAIGAVLLSTAGPAFGVAGYIAGLVVLTPGYQLFQAANNTAVMASIPADRRGVTSGLINLSRNLGLITGASAMGAIFRFASGTGDIAKAAPEAVTFGMQATFGTAAFLIVVAIILATGTRLLAGRAGQAQDAP